MHWIYFAVIEPSAIRYNVRLLVGVRRSATIGITGALRSIPTKVLFAMLNWIHTELLAEHMVKFTALSHWHIAPPGCSSILEIDIDYPSVESCFNRGPDFLIASGSD